MQTRFGKGVVRELQNGGRLKVEVHGRALVVAESEISVLNERRTPSRARPAASNSRSEQSQPPHAPQRVFTEIDLHGLTVQEALDRVQDALSAALLGDVAELRLIHGRSGGRIRAALHSRLRETRRRFRLDPQNEGVTVVSL